MIFSEIYGKYYQAVAEMLRLALENRLTEKKLYEISGKAFSESVLSIPAAIQQKKWPLLGPGLSSILRNKPFMPLSLLEKRWLKSLIADKRIRLFMPEDKKFFSKISKELEGIEPLFAPDDFVYFDRYSDGDDYSDENYARNFRLVLAAIRERRKIEISFTGARGKTHNWTIIPLKMEYSPKDDKFRIAADSVREQIYINMGRISSVSLLDRYPQADIHVPLPGKEKLVLELVDERKSLERAMLLFSYLKKETRKTADGKYLINLFYDNDDAAEILIRILSFGPMLKVLSPASFKGLLLARIKKQRQLIAKSEVF